jgi:hypothetical protein
MDNFLLVCDRTNFEGVVEGLVKLRATIGVDHVIPRMDTERDGD